MEIKMPRGGKRPGAGRPKKFGRALLHPLTTVQATRDQQDRWRRAAQEEGLELQDWIRKSCDERAARTLKDP